MFNSILDLIVQQAVWEKGIIDPYQNPAIYRKDQCGAWMKRDCYGNRDSDFGWEIDHIVPQSRGGSNMVSNLRPLQWRNNACKSDGVLTCPVTARQTY
ncbi:MAG: HNH endonuclease domain-containing protein [Patescibacteria group bacterium]|uniref:HNH endonuclease n=1 Tax=candidate division WWE3 bacterium TaxID=2053526 RepID=A0A955EBB3_UNCKA|nr:HNH endonuclease [candidate division WWE3 bacterium]